MCQENGVQLSGGSAGHNPDPPRPWRRCTRSRRCNRPKCGLVVGLAGAVHLHDVAPRVIERRRRIARGIRDHTWQGSTLPNHEVKRHNQRHGTPIYKQID